MSELTDEQREEILEVVRIVKNPANPYQLSITQNKIIENFSGWIRALLSSEQALQKENAQLKHRDRVVSLTNMTLGRYVREGKEEIEQLREQLKGIGVEEYLTLQRKHFETVGQLNQAKEEAERKEHKIEAYNFNYQRVLRQLNQAVEVLKIIRELVKNSHEIPLHWDIWRECNSLLSTLSQEGEKS